MNDQPLPSKRRRRFSLRFLLIGIAMFAAGLGIWQAVTYRHPAHANSSYEKAPYTSSHSMKVGPNTVSIVSIARNRYDGKLHLVSGAGLSQQIPNSQQLQDCASWLDVVQFEITPGPDLAEIIEVRVFDHETRDILADGYGWQVVEPNLVQVYGLGKEIPEKLDLWLRLNSYEDGVVYKLPPTKGASVDLAEGTISVSDVTDGYVGWSAKSGFLPSKAGSMYSAVQLDWQADEVTRVDYQVATVAKSGEKGFESVSLWPQGVSGGTFPVSSHFPLNEVDHYEVRPFGGRHRFFFDGVEGPPSTGRKFDPPPIVTINVKQGEREGILPELDPLKVRYQIEKGNNISGSAAGGTSAWILHDGPHEGIDKQFSLIFNLRGTKNLLLGIRLQDIQGAWNKPGSFNSYSAQGGDSQVSAYVFKVPLDEVKAIEVTPSFP